MSKYNLLKLNVEEQVEKYGSQMKKAGLVSFVLTQIWNKQGKFRLGSHFSYRDEKAFVACQKILNGIPQDEDNPTVTNADRGIVLLTFGDYKGSAIAMMIELLAAGLVGDLFSFEAKEEDNNDGGPARGGEFIMALSPQLIAGNNWNEHAEKFFEQMTSLDGVRLPGQRRHTNREDKGPRHINSELIEKIKSII